MLLCTHFGVKNIDLTTPRQWKKYREGGKRRRDKGKTERGTGRGNRWLTMSPFPIAQAQKSRAIKTQALPRKDF